MEAEGRKVTSGRRNSTCQGPEVGKDLVGLKNRNKSVGWSLTPWVGRVAGGEVRRAAHCLGHLYTNGLTMTVKRNELEILMREGKSTIW